MLHTKSYWLDAPDGRVMIGAWAVLIGRSPDCNIVLEQPAISRHHLLVRLGREGPEMLPLGRDPVRLNDEPCRALTPLRAGDTIGVGAWSFRLGEAEIDYAPRSRDGAWFVERHSGLLHLVTGPSYRVGGGADDDLIVEGWEPAVFALGPARDALALTALRPGVACGRPLAEGQRVALAPDAEITHRGESFRVRSRSTHSAVTSIPVVPKFAVVVILEFLPRGGRLTVEVGGRLRTTLLSDLRCDLVACLLRPPAPLAAGDFVPEAALCESVWPGEKNGRTELNSLLYRLRQSLGDEGIDPGALFERVVGAVRFCLAPGARVIVR